MHEFEENTVFTKCAHDQIGDRSCLTPSTPTHNALKSVITDKQLLNNMSYFTEFKHTGNIEVFHSVLLKYCPKRLHFNHHGMIAQTQLAVLHFNTSINAEQALPKDNVYELQFSKIT